MFFILAKSVFAALFTLCIKWVQVRKRDDMVSVGMVNYIFAATVALIRRPPTVDFDPNAVMCGASMGITYFTNFFFAVIAIRVVGAAGSAVIGSLSILMPILVAAMVWNDIPNGFEVIGVGLALVSLILIGTSRLKGPAAGSLEPPEKRRYWKTMLVLLVFFLLCGNARLSQEAYKHFTSDPQNDQFMVAAFACAAIPAICVILFRRRRVTIREVVAGSVMGAANLFQSDFIMLALENQPAYIVFPLASAGAMVLTTVGATMFLEERLTGKAYLGILIATLALVFLRVF